jgi:GNAT superfamily N-acetyltransferase/predicted nucleic acid-binding protein
VNEHIAIEKLNLPTPLLEGVIALHRQASKRLGFLPAGAFEESAKLGRILVAMDGRLLRGYLLYRVARGRASIVHLCVSPEARGKGVARALVEQLKQETRPLEGIGLRCRRDYDINHMWSTFGFEAVHGKAGRGKDGAELTYWWFGHGHADLFSRSAEPDPVRQRVVVDANVFYDLHARETPESEDSKALLADWVQASIELVITKELRNKIEKAGHEEQRNASRAEATRYYTLPADDAEFQRLCSELQPRFPESTTLRDDADLRQIAYAIAGGAPFFVTRDERLIERAEPLYRSHSLTVLHPAELISHLDSIEREGDYKPARVGGSRWKHETMKADALVSAVEAFRRHGERVNGFMQSLRHFLARPKISKVQVISDQCGMPVLLGVEDRERVEVLNIPILRQSSHPLAATMLRNFLRTCLNAAAEEARNLVVVRDNALSSTDIEILKEFGFISCGDAWAMLTLREIGDLASIAGAVADIEVEESLSAAKAAAISSLEEAGQLLDTRSTVSIERQLWPVKVIGTGVPAFIVPIRPDWAQHFFDVELGSQLLFGLRDDLHLGVEGAYYRSAANNNLVAPGRVLWYVSKGDGDGWMSIKACSQLEEVVVGKPKELFRRFQRLGVYEWKDVYAKANNDITVDLVAFRFRMTERFSVPVDTNALTSLNIKGPFMSPRRISEAQFAAIYRTGCSLT